MKMREELLGDTMAEFCGKKKIDKLSFLARVVPVLHTICKK